MIARKKPLKRKHKTESSFPFGIIITALLVLSTGIGATWYLLAMPSVKKATQLLAEGKNSEAVEMLEGLERKNDVEARKMLAHYYWFGQGQSHDREKALDFAKQMAMDGDAVYSAIVGKHLYQASDDIINMEASRHLRVAADSGDHESAELLGRIYFNGWGVAERKNDAIHYFLQAADGGRPQACALIGRLLAEDDDLVASIKTDCDEYLDMAIASDDKDAQFMAAETYYKIDNFDKSYPVFLSYIDDKPESRFYLAEMHYYGNGIEQDSEKAYSILKKIENGGDARAANLLGKMYFYGDGIEEDRGRAAALFTTDIEDPEAMVAISELKIDGVGYDQNIFDGIKILTRAANMGYPPAQRKLGEMYLNGDNIEYDRQRGIEWLTKAADSDDEEAERILGRYTNRIQASEDRRRQTTEFLAESAEREKEIEQLAKRARELEAEHEKAKQRALQTARSERTRDLKQAESREISKANNVKHTSVDTDKRLEREARIRKETERKTRQGERKKDRWGSDYNSNYRTRKRY